MLLEWLLISRLYNRDHLYQVLLTYGLILMFEETRSVIWGDDVHGVPMPDVLSASIPPDRHALVPGLSAVDVGRVPGHRRGDVLADPAHPPRA